MAITDYIPNVFGQAAPSYLPGLLGAEETKNLQNRANIQGLLGAGLALAQGMSNVGPRRSAAENILGALAGGFGAAGGAYEQGIKNYVTQQQIAQTQLAQTQAANRLRSIAEAKRLYPDIAALADIDPNKFAEEVALRQRMQGFTLTGKETPQELEAKANQIYATGVAGLKPYGDSLMAKSRQLAIMPPKTAVAPVDQPATDAAAQTTIDATKPALPPVEDTARRGKVGQIQFGLDYIDNELARVMKAEPTPENINYQSSLRANREVLAKQQELFSVMEYDFTDLKGLPSKYQTEVKQLQKQAEGGVLDKSGLNSRIEKIYTRLQEDERGRKLDGNAATFAQMRFGVTDRAQLTGPQLAEVLRFENAPNADQLATLQRAAIDTQFTTGRAAPIPSGREQFIVPGQSVSPQTAVEQQVTPQVVAPTPVVPTQTAQVRTQVPPQVTPQVVPQTQVTQTVARENAPAETKNLYSYNKNALINKSDRDYSPAKKQILLEKQAPLQSAVTYSLTSIKDARDAAQSLKNNPQYIDALTGRFSPLLSGTVGGVVVNQNAKTANDLLQNILTRSFVKEIQAMRQASPTGAAVGSVTEKEMDALSKVSASLSVGMSKDEFIKQLDNYLAIANRSLKNIPTEYSKTYGYNGEFDEILTTPGVSTTRTSGKTQVELELQRRKKGNQ
jgi:hypothetical protein